MKKLVVSLLSIFIGSFIFAIPAYAESLNINFEGPTYPLGVIDGIDGWTSTGAAGGGCAVYDHAVSGSLSTAGFGAQSLRISDAVTSGCFGDQTFAKPLVNAVGETGATASTYSVGTKQAHFEMQFDIASTTPGAQQPGMHASISPDRGDGSRMSYLRFEDQTDGIHVFFDDVTDVGPVGTVATFNETDIATISRTVHTIKLTLDTLDGPANDVVKVYIDGVLKVTGTSWEDYYRFDPEAAAEQSPRIVKTVLFRTSGTATPADAGKGFLFDNLSLLSGPTGPVLIGPPTNENQCKKDGWKTFNNPVFKNQGDCVSYVQKREKKNKNDRNHRHENDHRNDEDIHGDRGREQKLLGRATGRIQMSGPSQQISFSAFDFGASSKDKGTVEYWNYDYPGPLHYKAAVMCANVKPSTKEAWFMFQIPAGWPGLTGLYVVSYVKDVGTPGTAGDLYGHAASADLTTATGWCENGTAPLGMYPITGGNVVVGH